MGYKWKPLQRSEVDPATRANSEVIKSTAAHYGISLEEAEKRLVDYDNRREFWLNDLYQVQTFRFYSNEFKTEMMHLNIRRRDGAAIFDWRHRQLIKNQLVGEECEAFEIYPAESRLVDTSNKYHLWAFVDPEARIPVEIGDGNRDVIEQEVKGPPGMRQRGI